MKLLTLGTREVAVATAVLGLVCPGVQRLQAQRAEKYHVAESGSDSNPGTFGRPFRTIQRAVNAVQPGDTILVHEGTYHGKIQITRSGAPRRPIALLAAQDGPVTLTASLPRLSCGETSPTRDRTIQMPQGADHWIISGFTIVGGILVSGTNTSGLASFLENRSLPGRRLYDPAAASTTLRALGSDPADGVRIAENTILGRGILAVAARYGEVARNEIYGVVCGTGPGVSLSRFSDGWVVRGNFVHDIAASSKHWMAEGIRVTTASMYNLIEKNVVEDVAGPGRGITTDLHAGWNVIRNNVVRRAFQGFSEQEGGWGNRWIRNLSESNRGYGFNVLGMDADSVRPTDRTPSYLELRCNRSIDNPRDLYVGTVKASTFEANAFADVRLGRYVEAYWARERNTWDGSPLPPPENPRTAPCRMPEPPIFRNGVLFMIQQYRDLLDREADASGLASWAAAVESSSLTTGEVVRRVSESEEFDLRKGRVTRLLFAMTRHFPRLGKLTFWTNRLRDGMPLQEIAARVARSPEFQERYRGLGDWAFVIQLYRDVLQRDPEPGAAALWFAALQRGLSRPGMALAFSESPEFRRRSASRVFLTHLYTDLLGRSPGPRGFSIWLEALQSGRSRTSVAQAFLDSEEYHNRFRDD